MPLTPCRGPPTSTAREAAGVAYSDSQIGRAIERIPGVSSPRRSGPALASIVLDDRWARLEDGAFVVVDAERDVKPFATDPAREARLWEATTELLNAAERAGA
ncbi:hypothetical protein [Gordonia sp. SL306]|uniref:hypothetical protein n=1 Tax=Gordonia sp. SL306 TaxID=2995145 RepID=UPI00226D8712|nr:hypothetical protein [Gordonia sp. SL306]WAC55899.1 hypothetical protein OVA31_01080 [Gordonia sp. SL306]